MTDPYKPILYLIIAIIIILILGFLVERGVRTPEEEYRIVIIPKESFEFNCLVKRVESGRIHYNYNNQWSENKPDFDFNCKEI